MTVHQAKAVLSFKPIYSLVMLLGTLLCFSLGVWQFTKAQQFEHKDVPSFLLSGQLQAQPMIFLDNRTQSGQAGYHLYSVIRISSLESSDQVFYLLNRGFVALDGHTRLPLLKDLNLTAMDDIINIKARSEEPARPMILSNRAEAERLSEFGKNVWRVQSIDTKMLSGLLDVKLMERVLVQLDGEGMMQPLPESEPYMSRHKHLAYAVQWWLLSAAAVVIWLWSSWQREPIEQS